MAQRPSIDAVRAFIEAKFVDGDGGIDRDTPLVEAGILDSASMVELFAFIESEFDVEIPAYEAEPQNLATLVEIEALLERAANGGRDAGLG